MTGAQNMNQISKLQKTLHISPLRASYGESFARILEKIDGIITAMDCITFPWDNQACHLGAVSI